MKMQPNGYLGRCQEPMRGDVIAYSFYLLHAYMTIFHGIQ